MTNVLLEGNPEVRCNGLRCVHGEGHEGPCVSDDGSPKWKDQRQHWKDEALRKLQSLPRKPGRPSRLSKLSGVLTVSDVAEQTGVSRQQLYEWERDQKNEAQHDAPPAVAQKPSLWPNDRKAIHTINKMRRWVSKAASINVARDFAEHPVARAHCERFVVKAQEQLAKLAEAFKAARSGAERATDTAPDTAH